MTAKEKTGWYLARNIGHVCWTCVNRGREDACCLNWLLDPDVCEELAGRICRMLGVDPIMDISM